MAIASTVIEQALNRVGRVICEEPHYGDFLRHKSRYSSDASILSQVLDDDSPVLEIGSFPGHFTALMSALGIPCVGVDLEPSRLGILGEHFELDVRNCDIERQHPFRAQSRTTPNLYSVQQCGTSTITSEVVSVDSLGG